MTILTQPSEAALLEAIVAQGRIREELNAALQDPKTLAEMCGLATRPEDATEGLWFNFEEGSPHTDWHRFLREPTQRVKIIGSSRGTAKSTFLRMETAGDFAADHDFSAFYCGETAVSVRKRSLRLRTMLAGKRRQRFREEYGVQASAEEWGSAQWTLERPMGPGDPPSLEVSSADKPGTGSHYRRRVCDDMSGERGFQSQKHAERTVKYYGAMQAQNLAGTEEWHALTPWPGRTVIRHIRDELEGGFTWEPYGRYTKIHRGLDYDVLMVGVYDDDGKTIWPFLDETALARIKRKLGSKLLWKTQYLCEFVDDSELGFRGSWILFEDVPDDPPWPLLTYMSVDTATSTQGGKTSESALSALSLNPYNQGFLREMEMGQIPPAKLARRVIRMWKRWKPKRLLLEKNASAAQMLAPQLQEIAAREKLGRIVIHWVARETEKDYRILGFRDVCAEGRFHVCETVDPKMLSRGKGSQLVGSVGVQMMNWTYGVKERADGLDNLSDYWLNNKYGKRHCKPPEPAELEPEKTPATMEALQGFYKKVHRGTGWVG